MAGYISRKLLEDRLREEKERMLQDTIEVDPYVEGFQSAINIVKCTADTDVESVRNGTGSPFAAYSREAEMDEFALEPCPFCGGRAEYILNGIYKNGASLSWEFDVACTGCMASSSRMRFVVTISWNNSVGIVFEKDERDKAAKMWNRRVVPEAREVTE